MVARENRSGKVASGKGTSSRGRPGRGSMVRARSVTGRFDTGRYVTGRSGPGRSGTGRSGTGKLNKGRLCRSSDNGYTIAVIYNNGVSRVFWVSGLELYQRDALTSIYTSYICADPTNTLSAGQ